MKFDVYLSRMSNIYAENRLLKFAVVVMCVMSIYSMYALNRAVRYQKVILVPSFIDERIVISGDDAHESYIKLFAQNSANYLLSYTPQTCEGQFSELLKFIHPSQYAAYKESFAKILKTTRDLQVTSNFYVSSLEVNRKKNKITVHGMRHRYTGVTLIAKTAELHEIIYRIVNGRFSIVTFEKIKETPV